MTKSTKTILTSEAKEFISKKLTAKKFNPSDLLEILNEKYDSQIDYNSLANYMLKIEKIVWKTIR